MRMLIRRRFRAVCYRRYVYTATSRLSFESEITTGLLKKNLNAAVILYSFQPRPCFCSYFSVADHSSPWVWLTLGTHRASLAQVQPHTPLRLQIQRSNHTRPQLFLDLDPCSKCPWMKSFSLSFPSATAHN